LGRVKIIIEQVSTCRSQHMDKQSWHFCSIVKEDECHIVYNEKLLILGKSPDSSWVVKVEIHEFHFQQGKKAQFSTVMDINVTGSVCALCKVANSYGKIIGQGVSLALQVEDVIFKKG
jgi:hypothetical protein